MRASRLSTASEKFRGGLPLAFISAIALLCAPCKAATYVTIDPPGATTTYATGINDHGLATGWFRTSTNDTHAFVRAVDGTLTVFDPNGIQPSTVGGINNKGWVVGTYNLYIGFIRKPNGHVTTFSVDANHYMATTGIDDRGDVCGFVHDIHTAAETGFVRTADGTLMEFAPSGSTEVLGMNGAGTVTGYFADKAGAHGFVRTIDGTITTFDAPGATGTVGYGINAAGTVAGAYLDADDFSHGFIRDAAGNLTPFEVGELNEDYPFIYGMSINVKGEIAGYYDYADEYYRAFIRKPKGKVSSFDDPDASGLQFTEALAINRKGAIVGIFRDENYVLRAFLRLP